MKKTNFFTIPVFIILLSLTGCDTIGDTAGVLPVPEAGKGYVRLQFGAAASRTVLPSTYAFAANKITFTPVGSDGRQAHTFTSTNDLDSNYALEFGDWTLDVEVYSDAEAQNLVAEKKGITVKVQQGQPAVVLVYLDFKPLAGNGSLTWAITNSSGVSPDQTEIKLERLDAQGEYKIINITNERDNIRKDVPAGYYLATVRMEKDLIKDLGGWDDVVQYTPQTGIVRFVWSDILHIYPGQTTNLAHTFAPGESFSGVEAVWLFGDMIDWDLGDLINPKPKAMTKAADGTFTWKGDVAAACHFRFSLTDTSTWQPNTDENRKKGAWFIPASDGDPAVTGSTGNPVAFLPLHTGGVNKAWNLVDAGYYEITLDPVARKFFVAKPVIVDEVTVHSKISSIKKGTSSSEGDFTAVVTGKNVSQDVTWSIDGTAGTDYVSGTSIDSSTGILTVADGETEGRKLKIKATSVSVDSISGTTISSAHVEVEVSSVGPLDPVTTLSLSNAGVASWTYTDQTNVDSYVLKLYKTGTAIPIKTETVTRGTTTSYTHNFLQDMRDGGVGKYSFTVTVKTGNTGAFTDSEESANSGEQEVTQRTRVTNVWWYANGQARWVNPDGSGNYTIQLYQGTTAVGEPLSASRGSEPNPGNGAETITDYDFGWAGVPADNRVTNYTFTVTALGRSSLELDAEPSGSLAGRDYSVFGEAKVWTIIEGGGVYVAGANNGRIAWSTDGYVWTAAKQVSSTGTVQDTTAVFGSNAVRSIAYNGANLFVAVGHGGKAATSADGKEWTGIDSTFGSTNILTVAYGSGKFIAGGDGGNVRQFNGTAWSTITGWSGSTILDGQAVETVMYGSGNFVAVGTKGYHSRSVTGNSDWVYIAQNLDQDSNIHAVGTRTIKEGAVGNGTFVIAVADGNTSIPRSSNLGSANGDSELGTLVPVSWSWSAHQILARDNVGGWGMMESVVYDSHNNRFIAVGGHARVSTSTDSGASWVVVADAKLGGFTPSPAGSNGDTITAAHGMTGGNIILAGSNGKMTVITP